MGNQTDALLSPFLRKKRIEAVRPHLSGRILDFGCGVGVLAACCEKASYLGVDRDADSLALARKANPGHAFSETLPATGSFDTIVGLAVIEHVPAPENLLRRLSGLLAPGGRVILTSPHPAFETLHAAGVRLGFFSREAAEEHEALLNRETMARLARLAGLSLMGYSRFLFGANQLFILSPEPTG